MDAVTPPVLPHYSVCPVCQARQACACGQSWRTCTAPLFARCEACQASRAAIERCVHCEETPVVVTTTRAAEGEVGLCAACAERQHMWMREWSALKEGRVQDWAAIVWDFYGGERYGIEKFVERRRWNGVDGSPVTEPLWLETIGRGEALMRARWDRARHEHRCVWCGQRIVCEREGAHAWALCGRCRGEWIVRWAWGEA
jgi:hypothetical protein